MTDADTFREATARVESILYIPGAIADGEALPSGFKEFCEDLPDKADAPLYSQCPSLAQFASLDEWPDPYNVAEQLRGKNGFLVQAATPVRSWHGTAFDYSWGHYYTAWLYASEEAEIATQVAVWAAEMANQDKTAKPEPSNV